ncbi:MAG: LemA family protein [Pyrinomonadaceae bacterium]
MNIKRSIFLAVILCGVALNIGCGYNPLQQRQQSVRARWADIEIQLQRRSDLIPNLFEAAKAAGVQEQEVFGQIAESNSRLLNATKEAPAGDGGDRTPEQRQAIIDASNSFGGTVGRLLSLVQNYPSLRSSESFQKFQDSYEGTENRISTARKDYNDSVNDYNARRGRFPTLIAAKIYGFKEEPYFKADESAKTAPKIDANSVRK